MAKRKNYKWTSNDLQNITQITKDRATRIPLKPGKSDAPEISLTLPLSIASLVPNQESGWSCFIWGASNLSLFLRINYWFLIFFLHFLFYDVRISFSNHLLKWTTIINTIKSNWTLCLTPSPFIQVTIPSQESGRSCICVRWIDFTFFYDFDIWFWNCSENVVFCFVFRFYWPMSFLINNNVRTIIKT